MTKTTHKTLIALGSNDNSVWGDPKVTVQKAMKKLNGLFTVNFQCSRLFHTPAFPAESGPPFVNAVVAGETDLPAAELLRALHNIEQDAGRVRVQRWGQRTLDLDLLAMGGQVLPDKQTFCAWQELPLDDQKTRMPDQLILPHPRIQDRAFVLVPLCDVAADWRHPVIDKTAAQMRDALPLNDCAQVVPIAP